MLQVATPTKEDGKSGKKKKEEENELNDAVCLEREKMSKMDHSDPQV